MDFGDFTDWFYMLVSSNRFTHWLPVDDRISDQYQYVNSHNVNFQIVDISKCHQCVLSTFDCEQ